MEAQKQTPMALVVTGHSYIGPARRIGMGAGDGRRARFFARACKEKVPDAPRGGASAGRPGLGTGETTGPRHR
jgi:hypothetical protein